MEKTLTIVIPAYNIGEYIDEDLPTFLEEELLKDIEILIVNDGSKDDTAEKAREYEKKYPGVVKLINKENGGHGSTINKGIELAEGIYFKVVDGDDWVDTWALKELVLFLKNCNKKYDMIVNSYNQVFYNTGKTRQIVYDYIEPGEYRFEEIAHEIPPVEMHAITFRTDILKDNVIQLDENKFYVDTEYILFPIPYIKTVLFRPECIYQYRLFTEGQSVNPRNLVKNRNMHKEVLFTLVSFYNRYIQERSFNKNVEVYIRKRISEMVCMQINIYSLMKVDRAAKKELLDFERQLKDLNSDIYESADSKKINWLRKSNYRLYGLIAFFYRNKM